jgi:hypothetical protein
MSNQTNDNLRLDDDDDDVDDALHTLIAMGFDPSPARCALDRHAGQIEAAANYLLTTTGSDGGGDEQHASSCSCRVPMNIDVEQIQGTTSQYSFDHGRSACTFIALHAAMHFLNGNPPSEFITTTTTASPRMDATFLDQMVQDGCTTWSQWTLQQQPPANASEHTAVDDILPSALFPNLNIVPGGIRQGLLLPNGTTQNPSGIATDLYTLLLDCQLPTQWICIVMIKPPETILLCLPPKSSNPNNKYYLLDSHPRMVEFGAEQSYGRIHGSLLDLVQSVRSIFPVTDLGPDIPEYMAAMYHSFDLYPLQITNNI